MKNTRFCIRVVNGQLMERLAGRNNQCGVSGVQRFPDPRTLLVLCPVSSLCPCLMSLYQLYIYDAVKDALLPGHLLGVTIIMELFIKFYVSQQLFEFHVDYIVKENKQINL